MRRWTIPGGLLALMVVLPFSTLRAADDDALTLVRKGIATMGGEEKLTKAMNGMKSRTTGKLTIQGDDHDFTIETSIGGIDRIASKFSAEFNGQAIEVTTVLDGGKGWRKINGQSMDLDPDAVANEKRNLYLAVVPLTLVPLLDKSFKLEMGDEVKVGDKAARMLKVTGPDGKTFRLMLDKESGLPLKMTASVRGPGGDEYDQATTYLEYQDQGGIQKATKMEMTRDGDPFISAHIKDFQVVADDPAGTFAEPK